MKENTNVSVDLEMESLGVEVLSGSGVPAG